MPLTPSGLDSAYVCFEHSRQTRAVRLHLDDGRRVERGVVVESAAHA